MRQLRWSRSYCDMTPTPYYSLIGKVPAEDMLLWAFTCFQISTLQPLQMTAKRTDDRRLWTALVVVDATIEDGRGALADG